MTTAEVFSNYLGLTPENAPWAFGVRKRCSKCNKPDDPAWRVRCLWCGYEGEKGMPWYTPLEHYVTATSPLAPEPTPGWRERMEEHRAFIALERLCVPRMYRATCLILGNTKDQGETVKFDDPHPTHAVACALIAADPTLREACERAVDYEKETSA